MNKIPTAEEFFKDKGTLIIHNIGVYTNDTPIDYIIEFTKLYVQDALKTTSELQTHGMLVTPLFNEEQRKRILNAYPLDNIK